MSTTWKYIGSTGLSILVSCLVVGLGFNLASERFYSIRVQAPPPVSPADGEAGGLAPTSPLLGRVPDEQVLTADAHNHPQRKEEWVEVTDAVNMRGGGSSSEPVIKVQLEGERLRVASRNGGWVEVVEPETELTGWVYERYVKPAQPESKQAGLVDPER
jgi:hypothetical protein